MAIGGEAILGSLTSIGSSLLGGLFGKNRQASSARDQAALANLQNKYNVLATNKQWRREKAAATLQYKRAERAAVRAYKREENAYKNRFQWAREDMRLAGLNPILAASGGFNVGSGVDATAARPVAASAQALPAGLGHAPMHSINMPDFASSARDLGQAMSSFKEVEKKDAEIDKLLQDTKTSATQARKNIQDVAESRTRQGKFRAEEKRTIQEMFNLEANFSKILVETDKLIQETRNLELNEMERRKNIDILDRNYKILGEDLRKMIYENRKLERISEAYKGKFGPFLGYGKAILDMIGMNANVFFGFVPKIGPRVQKSGKAGFLK